MVDESLGAVDIAAGAADGGQDFVGDPAFEGFGFGFSRAENKRVKASFVYKREFGFAACSTII